MNRFSLVLAALFMALHSGAADIGDSRIRQLDDSLRRIYAPDRRVARMDIDYTIDGRSVMMRGTTTCPEALAKLDARLREMGYTTLNCVRTEPDTEKLGDKTWAIVNMSVCNLRTDGDYGEEQSTQALLGMPLRILRRDGWLMIQTPDDYIAWVLPSGVAQVSEAEMHTWNNAAQVVVTEPTGWVYREPSDKSGVVSDVVASDRLRKVGEKGRYYQVEYPDGRRGYISKAIAADLDKWRKGLKRDAQSIIATGKRLIGVPYMWGGTSAKGVDCSGFIRTTLMQHDIIIPRDASQQAVKGQRIETDRDNGFRNLEPGDLLFFGSRRKDGSARVSHVGMYTGQQRFIHSLGFVREASFNPADPDYDAYDLGRLLWAQRILPHINQEPGLTTTDRNEYYK